MHQDIQEKLFSKEEIEQRVTELGSELSKDYNGRTPICVCVLKGSIVFTADLIREMTIPILLDALAVSSYGSSSTSSGVVQILKDLDHTVEDRHVLIVEDIVDTGLTLHYLKGLIQGRNPASLKVVSFLDKPSRRKVEVKPDYCGFTIPNHFVVGYGFDYAQRYRNLPYVGALKKEVYANES